MIPDAWKEAGKISAEALDLARGLIKPGLKILDLALEVEGFIERKADIALPCVISVDNIACHFSPYFGDETVLEKGSVVSVDTGACVDGYIGDNCITVEVGNGNEHTELIKASREALDVALEEVRPGMPITKPADFMSQVIIQSGFRVVPELTGHFVERYCVHTPPPIPTMPHPHFNKVSKGTFEIGHVATFEPFATTGNGRIEWSGNSHLIALEMLPPNATLNPTEQKIVDRYSKTGGFASVRWLSNDEIDALGYNIQTMTISKEQDPDAFVSYFEKMFLITENGAEVLTPWKG